MEKITPQVAQEVNKLRSYFPSEITVFVQRSKDGGFCAQITTFPGCFTEAETLSELVENVNDAIITYFEIPEKYIELMPPYCPPTELAKKMGIYPNFGAAETLKLILDNCES